MVKFWPSRAPEKGVCGEEHFWLRLTYSQRAVFASPLDAFFIIIIMILAEIKVTLSQKC